VAQVSLPHHNGGCPRQALLVWVRKTPGVYDFNVWSAKKRIEKLRYMHRNPVKRGLVASPELWRWSSFRYYAYGEPGPVAVNAMLPLHWTAKKRTAA